MFTKSVIVPELRRRLTPPFAWVDRRFLFDGYLGRLSPKENLLYFFLVLVADRDGLSFYSYDRICELLQFTVDDYIRARNGLIKKELIAFDGRQFQVLDLPRREILRMPGAGKVAEQLKGPVVDGSNKEAQALSEILARLAQKKEKTD
jgi:hypothetical protein